MNRILRSLAEHYKSSNLKNILYSHLEKMEAAVSELSVKRSNEECEDENVSAKKMKVMNEDNNTQKGLPYKKKKVAMMLVYSGKDYFGMQRNHGVRTIESELLTALRKAGVVTEDHVTDPAGKMKFQRAARTDKGVSAAGQVCSLKMFIDVENPVEKINSHLPKDINVLSIKRTTQGFDCKNSADARTYLYFIPTFAFAPVTEFVQESYRINDETINKVNEILQLYKGTHNFHNFTSGKKPTDKSATRYIMNFEIGQPFIKDGLEFAEIKIKGQSFMLHQIRKMIGLTIAIIKGLCNADIIDSCWGPKKVDVPKAPGLGLMLDTIHYMYYNKKFSKTHELLEWSDYKEKIEKFKEEFIFKTMVDTEKEDKSMMKWLETLHFHKLTVLLPDESGRSESGRSALWKAQRCIDTRKEENKITDDILNKETLNNENLCSKNSSIEKTNDVVCQNDVDSKTEKESDFKVLHGDSDKSTVKAVVD